MKYWLMALTLALMTGVQALAEDGPVQIYVHRDSEAAQQGGQTQSEYLEYRSDSDKSEGKRRFTSSPAPYTASDGGMMFGLTPGQSRWEYGLSF